MDIAGSYLTKTGHTARLISNNVRYLAITFDELDSNAALCRTGV